MSAGYFRTLIAYNRWAWTRVLDQVALCSDDEYTSTKFNFGSLRSTLLHTSGTEASYLARLAGETPPPPRSEETLPDVASLRQRWEQQFDEQQAWAATLSDAEADADFSYVGGNGRTTTSRRDLFLAQLINHSTQHRAEVAVAITEFGHSPGDLDVSMFVRENGPVA